MSQDVRDTVSPHTQKKRNKKHAAVNNVGHAGNAEPPNLPGGKQQIPSDAAKKVSRSSMKSKASQQQLQPSQQSHVTPVSSFSVGESAERDPLSQDLLQSHAAFFDHLVELVPARYYHDLDADRVNTKYMKKTDRMAAKAAFSKQHKQNKRDKLNPEKQQGTLAVQKQLAAESTPGRVDPPAASPAVQSGGKGADRSRKATEPSAAAGCDYKTAGGARPQSTPHISLDSAPRSELKERLAAKVALLRDARHAEERAARLESAQSFRETAGGRAGAKPSKRARDVSSGGRAAEGNDSGNLRKGPKRKKLSDEAFHRQLADVDQVLSTGKKPPGNRPRPSHDSTATELSFGQLAIGTAESQLSGRQKAKPRKESKAALLEKAEARQAASTAPGQDASQGGSDNSAWGAAMKRARGEKVLDDPTRLRRSLKKDNKALAKRKNTWAQRTAEQTRSTSDRQKKREENLTSRAAGKIDRKKAKREKKLLRPGFEGRRSTSIGKKR